MKKLVIFVLSCFLFTGCNNQDITYSKFYDEIDSFCISIQEIDSAINNIDNITTDEAGLKTATKDLLYNLDILNDEFIKFANIDFPEEYDYLESVADEASDYMNEAVNAYHKSYEEKYTASMEEYAQENYSRAYKRVQIILEVLRGDVE